MSGAAQDLFNYSTAGNMALEKKKKNNMQMLTNESCGFDVTADPHSSVSLLNV